MSGNRILVTLAASVILIAGSVSYAWAGDKFKTLHKFAGAMGAEPAAGLIFDSVGNLYGTTEFGGRGFGTVFELTPNKDGSWKEKVLHSLDEKDGNNAASALIFDSLGNLYGTASTGGVSDCENGCGLVFELTPNEDGSWKESVLHFFDRNGKDGYLPESSLVFDSSGNLYGTTAGGGPNNAGIVFQLSPSGNGSWKEKVLHSFNLNYKDGYGPDAGLVFDSAGAISTVRRSAAGLMTSAQCSS